MAQTITYTEPKKETFKWLIIKHEEGKSSEPLEFDTKKQAYDFLSTITVYVDGVQKHKEVSEFNKHKGNDSRKKRK